MLKREIGTFSLMMISFTAIFGSGWLFAPLYAAQAAGPCSILAWIIGGVMASVIGITMAEIITLFPKAGGINSVIEMTHGKLLSFLTNILMLIVCIILPVLEVRAILQYLASKLTFLMGPNDEITIYGYLFACALLLIINWLNIYGARLTARINSLALVFKLITPLLVSFALIYVASQDHIPFTNNLHSIFNENFENIFIAISTSGIIFSFNGFNQATLFAAEAKNPQRSIPFAILGSIIFATLLYLLLQYVFLISIPNQYLANGWSALRFPGDSGPFAGLAIVLGLNVLLYFIYADAIISPLGTAFTYASVAPRMIYAFSKSSGRFPLLARLNNRGVPPFALFVSFALGFIAFVFLPSLKAMISLLVAAFVLNYTVAPISLISLRNTYPQLKRPFKVPSVKVFCFLSLVFSNIMVFSTGFTALKNLMILLLVTAIIGTIFIKFSENIIKSVKAASWFVIELFVLTILAYLNEIKYLSFGYCFLFIILLSIGILHFTFKRSINTNPEILTVEALTEDLV